VPGSLESFQNGLELFIQDRYHELIESLTAEDKAIENPPLFRGKGHWRKVNNWKLQRELKFSWEKPLRKQDLIQYAVLSWFLPFRYLFEVQESLLYICERQLEFFDIQIYLETKELMIKALYMETIVTQRELFGNILSGYITKKVSDSEGGKPRRVKLPLRISILWTEPTKVHPPQRKRGYNDHGALQSRDHRVRRQEIEKEAAKRHDELNSKRIQARIHLLQLKVEVEGEGS